MLNTATDILHFAGGWASITPRGAIPLTGFGPGRVSRGDVDVALEANAIMLQCGERRVVIVQLDALSVGRPLREQVVARFADRLRDEDIFLVASHTHFAPSLAPRLTQLGPTHPAYLTETIETVCGLIDRILSATPCPIRLNYHEGKACHSINRRAWCWRPVWRFPPIRRVMALHPNPAGPRDETVRLFSACDIGCGETPLGILWHYTCHPLTTSSNNVVSADYPGVVRQSLRRRFGTDLPVVFLPGFSGNIRPNRVDHWPLSPYYLLHRLVNGPVFGRFNRSQSRHWTSTLANIVLKTTEAKTREIDVSGITSVRLQIPLAEIMNGKVDDRYLTFHVVHINPHLSMLGISAEPVIEYAAQLSQVLAPRTLLPIGYIDGVAGYLPTSEMLAEGGLEVSSPGYGLDNATYRADISDFVLDSAKELLALAQPASDKSNSPCS